MRAISGRDRPRRAEYQHTSALLSAHHDIINPRALHHGYASGEGALIFTSGVSRQRTFQHLALEDLVNLHSLEPLCAPAIQLESPAGIALNEEVSQVHSILRTCVIGVRRPMCATTPHGISVYCL